MNSPADTPKDTSPRKVEARLPRGFGDRGPQELAAMRGMLENIRTTFELYGFEAVETPFIEYTEALGKFLPDLDRPNEGVFSFQDDDDQWLSLRYDLTAPLARYVAEHFDALPKPYRSYRNGYVFRNEKPGPGRFRQFMQFDADTVGAPGVSADAEMCMLMADTLHRLGLHKRKDENGDEEPYYVVKINNRKIMDGVLEAIGLIGDENEHRRLTVLRAIDKADKFPWVEIKKLLGEGRKDESGDFTRGAGLNETQIARIEGLFGAVKIEGFNFVKVPGDRDYFAEEIIEDASRAKIMFPIPELNNGYFSNLKTLDAWEKIFVDCPKSLEGISELREIIKLCEASGFGSKKIRVSSSVVRGLEYYTGPVFEAELNFEDKGSLYEDGRSVPPVRFGSVAGGGRYDGLVARFRGEPVPATGFSVGVSRLLSALSILGKLGGQAEAQGPVVVLVMDKDQIAQYQKLVSALRNANPPIKAELYLGGSGMKAQMKYADKRGSVCVVIQGSDEREKGQVLIKDLVLGATLSSAPDRDAYLKQQAEAQFPVLVGEMIEAVRKVLARHSAF